MSQGKAPATEVQKKTEPAHQLEQEVARQPEQGSVQQVAPQTAYRRAQVNSNRLTPADILALQHTAGNRGVQRILAQRIDSANGQQPRVPTEEDPGSKVQTKLAVDAPNDIYEQEADRVAKQVMRMPEPGSEKERGRLQTHELTHVIQQYSGLKQVVQRNSEDVKRIIQALQKPDPIAGMGDFIEAFKILNGLAMFDILATLTRLKGLGHFDILNANLNNAKGVNVPRLQIAFKAVQLKGSLTAERFATDQESLWSDLPSEQKTDIINYLSPKWVAPIRVEDVPELSDTELGAEYGRALQGDPKILHAIEEEIDKRDEKNPGFGTAATSGGAVSTPGTTAITPEVAFKILENYSKGELPWKPELGKGGSAWFVTEGNPHVGIDPSKNINVEIEIQNLKEAIVFGEKELIALHQKEMKATEVEAEVKFREYNKIAPDKPLSNRLQKSLRRPNGFHEKFAEARMWDRIGEQVARSSQKIGKVILQNSHFSKQGDGVFAVVADPAKIRIKGGPTKLIETLSKAGVNADPVVVEAAEALATKLKWAGRVRNVFRYGGRILIVVAVAADVYKIYKAKDHVKATIESVGGWTGATAGGAAFAAWWAPADVAGPWAWAAHGVGTLVAGGIGYWLGSEITRTIYELVVED